VTLTLCHEINVFICQIYSKQFFTLTFTKVRLIFVLRLRFLSRLFRFCDNFKNLAKPPTIDLLFFINMILLSI